MIDWFSADTWQYLSYTRLVWNAGFALIMFVISAMPVLIKFEVDEETGKSLPRLKRERNRGIDYLVAAFFFGIGLNALTEAALFLLANYFTLGYFLANFVGRFPTYLLAVLMIFGSTAKGKEMGKALLSSEDVLKREAANAKRKAEEYGQLLSIASHDLNSPAKGILGLSEILEKELEGTGEPHDLIVLIRQAAKTICDRIDGLAEYNKTRKISDDQTDRYINMNDVIKRLCEIIEIDLMQSGGRVEYHQLHAVSGSKVHIAQAFQNLILNSLRYAKPGTPPRITLASKPHGRAMIEFSVSDNGIGFEQDQAERIFDLYRSAHIDDRGTGVGLTIVKNIITAHGGTIRAESQPEAGATFYLTLPKAV